MEKLFTLLLIGLCIQVLAIMTTFGLATFGPRYRSVFGESCNKTIRCKSQSWLVCNPETFQCVCAKPDEMIYDNDREKCVAMIGERCKYGFGSDVGSAGLFYEKLDCIGGAICGNEDGTCACPIGTYEAVEENKCLPVKSRGANCQLTTECDQTASLICLDGKCECPNDDMLFDDIKGSCRIKAGKSCSSFYLSLPIVFGNGSSHSEVDCVNGSKCMSNSGICTCAAGTYMSSGNCLPLKGLESHCGSSEECDGVQMLTCVNRRCECDPTKATNTRSYYNVRYTSGYDDYSYFSYTVPGGICVGKVGTSCSIIEYEEDVGNSYTAPAVNGMHCIRNGFCKENSICACTNGYSKTSDGLCGLGYGQECSEIDVCTDKFTCTPSNPGNIKCRCPNQELQVYVDNECKGVVGGPCEQGIGCVKNAHCVDTMEPNEKGSVCECQEGFIEFDTHNCDAAYGLKCDPTSKGTYSYCCLENLFNEQRKIN